MNRRVGRIQRDLEQIAESPQPNIAVWPDNDEQLTARLTGPENSPFAGGFFYLSIKFPDRYPFEPPHITFKTRVYHPNIDAQGRICLDLLKLPPQGSWRPHINISTCLTSVLLLMTEPNPNDPLVPEIAEEFKSNRALFEQHARQLTQKYAVDTQNQTNNEAEEVDTALVSEVPVVKSSPEKSSFRDGGNVTATTSSFKANAASTQPFGKETPCAVSEKQPVKNSQPPSERSTQAVALKKDPFAVLGKKPKPN